MSLRVPEIVVEAQRDHRRHMTRHVWPASVWMVLSSIAMAAALQRLPDELQLGLILAWAVGMALAALHMTRGSREARKAELIVEVWETRQTQAVTPQPTKRDVLMESLDASLVPLVQRCQDDARKLRAQAAAARTALEGLPPEGEGARALAQAIEQAEARAARIDDQLAALYAQALVGSEVPALEQLRARAEVESAEPARERQFRAQRAKVTS